MLNAKQTQSFAKVASLACLFASGAVVAATVNHQTSNPTGTIVLYSHPVAVSSSLTSASAQSTVSFGAEFETLADPVLPEYTRPINPIGDVTLVKPEALVAPTLAYNINAALMSDELMSQMESRYAVDLKNFEDQNGYSEISKDSRSSRPVGWTEEHEIQVRSEMARSLREYMIVRGIPKFLQSREDTKKMGQNYSDAVKAVANVSTVQIKTANNWMVNTGINPITENAWFTYTNTIWTFQATHDYKHNYPLLRASKHWGRYNAEVAYHLLPKVWVHALNCTLNKKLNAGISQDIPMVNTMNMLVTKVSVAYAF